MKESEGPDRLLQGERRVLELIATGAVLPEVLEALWPDLEPVVAVNSLNQTIYFLRRAFEPGYN